MAHKTTIDGTARSIKAGRAFVNGTAYDIKKGRTLVGGVGYDVSFAKEPVAVSMVISRLGTTSSTYADYLYVDLDGVRYTDQSTSTVVYVIPGTTMLCVAKNNGTAKLGSITVNGVVLQDPQTATNAHTAEIEVNGETTVTLTLNTSGTNNGFYLTIDGDVEVVSMGDFG